MMMKYVVVRFGNQQKPNNFYVYSKSHSDISKAIAYMKSIKAKYNNNYKWYVMEYNKALAERHKFNMWCEKRDRAIVDKALRTHWFPENTDVRDIKELMEVR